MILVGDHLLLKRPRKWWQFRKAEEIVEYGCATGRIVVAGDADEAFNVAVELARRELQGMLANAPDDPPRWEVDEITDYDLDTVLDGPNKGFTFLPDEPARQSVCCRMHLRSSKRKDIHGISGDRLDRADADADAHHKMGEQSGRTHPERFRAPDGD